MSAFIPSPLHPKREHGTRKHKRAPRGYRIERWIDGAYHVYRGGDILDEVVTKRGALELAWGDKAKQSKQIPSCQKCGCTDSDCSGCIERTGEPCYWVEPDLCSACAETMQIPSA